MGKKEESPKPPQAHATTGTCWCGYVNGAILKLQQQPVKTRKGLFR